MEDDMVDLLSRRMQANQLSKDEIVRIEPMTFRSLHMLCASCENREECELGLADDFADVAWDAYCPNAVTLKALGELPWFRHVTGSAGCLPRESA
jgi:hypothetical protein